MYCFHQGIWWPHQIGRWEFHFWFPMLQIKERKKEGELKRRKPSSWFCFLKIRGKSGYCYTIKIRRTMCEIHRISRDPLSISTSSCKYYGKLYQLIVDKMTEDSGSSEMKISVTLLSKEPRTAEVLAEVKGNMGMIGERCHWYQLWPCDHLQKWGL